jgi:hypothetical protein
MLQLANCQASIQGMHGAETAKRGSCWQQVLMLPGMGDWSSLEKPAGNGAHLEALREGLPKLGIARKQGPIHSREPLRSILDKRLGVALHQKWGVGQAAAGSAPPVSHGFQ